MSDLINNAEDILKKQHRRNWLHKFAIMATGVAVLLLVFTSCKKEQWNKITGKGPGSGVGGSDNWYILKVTFKDK